MSIATDVLDEAKAMPELGLRPDDAGPPATLPVTTIEGRPGWLVIDSGERWRYRELLSLRVQIWQAKAWKSPALASLPGDVRDRPRRQARALKVKHGVRKDERIAVAKAR